MENKIKVQIYGEWDSVLGGGCNSKIEIASSDKKAASGCGGCCGNSGGCNTGHSCGDKAIKTMGELFGSLNNSLVDIGLNEHVELQFLDIRRINVLDYDDIRILFDRGYELPYCVVDGIVRYYGGIPEELIIKDVKELLE
jgi:hypothetical protein